MKRMERGVSRVDYRNCLARGQRSRRRARNTVSCGGLAGGQE